MAPWQHRSAYVDAVDRRRLFVSFEDMHPVVAPTELEGFVVAYGFSGRGFNLAPAIGGLVARWLTGDAAEFDPKVPIDFLAVDRAALAVREKNLLA